MSTHRFRVSPGRPLPLGTEDRFDGFNFAIFSRHAERVELLLFEDAAGFRSQSWPSISVRPHHRTGDIWHALVEGARWGQAYAYRVHGPVGARSAGIGSTATRCCSTLIAYVSIPVVTPARVQPPLGLVSWSTGGSIGRERRARGRHGRRHGHL